MSVKIELENIGLFRGKRIFAFEKGLNVIYAPNASGKTSILMGLKVISTSALTSEDLSRALNDYEERGNIKLTHNGQTWAVELIRRPNGSVETVGRSISNDSVIKIVAFVDLENKLTAAVYSGMEDEVVNMIREVTGVTYIERISSVLSSLEASYRHKYEIKREGYEKAKHEVEDQIRHVEERLRSIRERIIEIRKDPSLEPVRKELEDIEAQRKDIVKELKEIRIKETEINSRLGLLDKEISELETRHRVFLNDLETLEEERETIQEKIFEVRKTIENLENEISELSGIKERLERERRELGALLTRRRGILNYARCPYCGCEISKNRILVEIHELEDKIKSIDDKLEDLEHKIGTKRRKIRELKEGTEIRLREIEDQIYDLNSSISEIESKLETLKDEKSKLLHELERIRREEEKLERELRVLKERLGQLSEKAPKVDELRKLEEEEEFLSKNLDYIYGRKKQLEEIYKEVETLRKWLESAKLLREYFEERKNELSTIVINRINEEMSRHFTLLKLAELEYPVIKKDFTLRIVRTGGIQSSLIELSDAEKAIFTILLTLTLKDYTAQDFPFYIVDGLIELIDNARVRAVLNYLKDKADERLVVITTKNKPFTGEPKEVTQSDILINEVPRIE